MSQMLKRLSCSQACLAFFIMLLLILSCANYSQLFGGLNSDSMRSLWLPSLPFVLIALVVVILSLRRMKIAFLIGLLLTLLGAKSMIVTVLEFPNWTLSPFGIWLPTILQLAYTVVNLFGIILLLRNKPLKK